MTQIESPDLTSPQFKADPHPFYARLRAEAPVYRIRWIFGSRAWIVTRYEDVLTVLKDRRFSKDFAPGLPFVLRLPFVLPPMFARNLLQLDPPDHTRLRALVNKAFTPRVVERLRNSIQRICDELLDTAVKDGSMELVRGFALPVPLTVIADLLGIPAVERRQFGVWSKRVAGGDTGRVIDGFNARVSFWRFGRYFRKLVALRRAEPQDDLVTALIEAEEAGEKLDEQELIAMMTLLLFAGHETTAHLIAVGALVLMQHPTQKELLQANPDLAESAIEELLRYTSPGDFATPRIAREEVTLGGARIPRGAVVLAALGSANRDESQFRHPDALDITREPNRHLAFGMGAHFCVGAPLARLEGQIALTTLFRRFPDLRPARPPESLRWRRGLLLRGLEELPVAW